MTKIVIASANLGKLKEFKQLLSNTKFEVIPQSSFNIQEAQEDGLSFVENAIIKARNASKYTGLPAIADDSGLEVDVLQGQPGIYSARYAGPEANDIDNNEKLLLKLQDYPESKRTARFQCVLVFIRHEKDPTPLIFQANWEGKILFQARGNNGFGYDPLFYVPEEKCSSAELAAEIKNRISHRGKAMSKLLEYFVSHSDEIFSSIL